MTPCRAIEPAKIVSSNSGYVKPHRANFGLLLRLEARLFELECQLGMPMDRVAAVILAFGEALRTLPSAMPFRLIEGAA